MEGVNKKLGLFGTYVDIFKGIPFAAPPKALENPQRHPGWQGGSGRCWSGPAAGGGVVGPPPSRQPLWSLTGTLKAKSFKKRCLQATITQDDAYGSEDCLYLNIWVPQGKKEGVPLPRPPAPRTLQEAPRQPGFPALPLGCVWAPGCPCNQHLEGRGRGLAVTGPALLP